MRSSHESGRSSSSRAYPGRVRLDNRAEGEAGGDLSVEHLQPLPAAVAAGSRQHAFRPFGGAGARPPPLAGPIVEIRLAAATHARTVDVSIRASCSGV